MKDIDLLQLSGCTLYNISAVLHLLFNFTMKNIKVTTIGHYHRDQHMNIKCGLLPKKLNENKKYLDDPKLPVPHVNLNVETLDSGAGELKMESLLEYIRQTSVIQDHQPHFITNKQLLWNIASSRHQQLEVQAVKVGGVIYLVKTNKMEMHVKNMGKVFEQFMTGTKENKENEGEEENGIVTKAVFLAEIQTGTKKNRFKIIYSGEIDAIDDDNQHYELKVTCRGSNGFFWKYNSCKFYWQAILSNVSTLVVGARTGKYPNDRMTRPPLSVPACSLFGMRAVKVKNMPYIAVSKANDPDNTLYKDVPLPRKPEWTVREGEVKLQNFLKMVSEQLEEDGDCFKFSKDKPEDEWTMEKESYHLYNFIVAYA